MNRSILIVICDFLLLSLLTFSTDINRMADETTTSATKPQVVTNTVATAGADLASAMKRALEEERHGREQLQQQLSQIRNSAAQQQTQLSSREAEYARLQQQYTAAQANLQNVNRELQTASAQAQMSQQQLMATQQLAQASSEQLESLRRQLDQLAHSNQLAQTEQQQLNSRLQVAEAEKRAAADRASLLQQEVQATHAENAKLAEGFQTLATNSSQLTKEIRENRALAPNTIFSDFISNRVDAAIAAARAGWFDRDLGKSKTTKTILVSDGTNYFAICHVQETPLALWDPGTDWDKLTGTLSWQSAQVPIRSLAFNARDPRVVMIPLTAAEAQQLGSRVYRVSVDPYRFQDAVLVGAEEGYYGECNFQIDTETPNYFKLDRSVLRGLFGKFNPSRGDLVFSRAGELLGVMVNNTYCLALQNFATTATFPFGLDLKTLHTGNTLARLYDNVFQLPFRLQ